MSSIIQQISIMALPLLLGVILHEVAHGWVANKFGDSTARLSGRLTLNPLAHIDPFGSILIPGILFCPTPLFYSAMPSQCRSTSII